MLPNVGWFEMMMLLGIAVLLFGKRLPEVGRSLGKGIVEFKKGLSGAVDEFDISSTGRSSWNSGSRGHTTNAASTQSRPTPIRPSPSSSCQAHRRHPPPSHPRWNITRHPATEDSRFRESERVP